MTEFILHHVARVTAPATYQRKRAIAPSGLLPESAARYDFDTFFYDAVRKGRDLYLVAPKLLNFRKLFRRSGFAIGGVPLRNMRVFAFYRHAIIRFRNVPDGARWRFRFQMEPKPRWTSTRVTLIFWLA